MKRLLLLSISALFLTACTEEKKQFEEAVLQRMKTDKDILDYRLDPETVTKCAVDLTSSNMPGFFSFDPRRKPYYIGYTKMLSLEQTKDPKAVLQELQTIFGSGKGVADAHRNYSESVMECMQNLVQKNEESKD